MIRLNSAFPSSLCMCVCVLPREGAPRLGRDSQLRVGRDTELYRILNMHYNKSNVYQVSVLVCDQPPFFFSLSPFTMCVCVRL